MKVTKKQLRKVVQEAYKLLEYEQYVDEDGNVYDDEGNVSRRGKSFGRRYGGDTYGLNSPWSGRSRSSSSRKTSHVGVDANEQQIAAIEAVLELKPNNFLTSILSQLKKGRGLSDKQKKIVRSIIKKAVSGADMVGGNEAAALFEIKNAKK